MTACLAQTHFMHRAGQHALRQIFGEQSVEPCRLLIVEDDADVRMCFAHLFRLPTLAHCSISFADSVNQACAMMVANCFDLCILDYRLADGTAADLVKWMAEFGYELPFVMVSGYDDTEQEMRNLGAVAFIRKAELTHEELARTIRIALGDYWRQRAKA